MLAGLGALPLSACAAIRDRALVAAKGCVDAAIPAGGQVVMLRGRLPTRHVAEPIQFILVLPADLVRRVEAVIYILPGRGGTADGVVDGLGFAGFFAAAMRAHPAPIVLATLDAGQSYFHRRVSGEDRLAAVTDDLAAMARKVAKRPLREALIGQSMGGYGALLAAEREPHRFRSVAVAGPALFPSFDDERRSVGDAFDSAADFARNDVIAQAGRLRATPVMIRCGDKDPFVPGVRTFAKRCPTADVRVVPGCHTDGFWRATAAELMAFTVAHL